MNERSEKLLWSRERGAGENIRIESATAAHERHPERNEDAYFVSEDGYAGVFDGVGGHRGSELASRFVADFCRDAMETLPANLSLEESETAMRRILIDASLNLQERYQDRTTVSTTAVLTKIFIDPSTSTPYVCFAHAGDSRGYLLRQGGVAGVTVDHSDLGSTPRGEVVRAEEVQEALSSAHYYHEVPERYRRYINDRNLISSMLTSRTGYRSKITCCAFPLEPGDTILLTSDGIHDNLTTEEIMTATNAGGAARLVAKARARSCENTDDIYLIIDGEEVDTYNFRPKPDDMTVVALYIPSIETLE